MILSLVTHRWLVWKPRTNGYKNPKPKIENEPLEAYERILTQEFSFPLVPRSTVEIPGDACTGLEMKREGSMHLVPAPAVRLMKSRVTSRPGNKVYNLEKPTRNQALGTLEATCEAAVRFSL